MDTTQFADAIALLKADHREVEDLFAQYESARTARKRNLAVEICNSLKIHSMIEEEIFYPSLSGIIDQDSLNEAYVEHDGAKLLINDIMASAEIDDLVDAKVKVLSEEIKHHVKEEEARSEGIFAQARNAGVDLVALRDQLASRKAELQQLASSDGLPPAELRVVQQISA